MLTAGAKSYTYDAAGRTVGINAPSGTTTLSYDYESRVTAITGPGINETHTYNGLDTRVGTVQGGVSRTFVRDGSYVTDPVLRDGQATYTPGVSERRGGVSTWSHSGLKNADAQTTSVGAIAATRVYDAFGAELSATGTWKGPFGYAGGFGYQEDSSVLKLLGHRYYDPTTGRFLSRDPIKDGRNWYVYCSNRPLQFTDPTGLSVEVGGEAEIIAKGGVSTSSGLAFDPWTGRLGVNFSFVGVAGGAGAGAGGYIEGSTGKLPSKNQVSLINGWEVGGGNGNVDGSFGWRHSTPFNDKGFLAKDEAESEWFAKVRKGLGTPKIEASLFSGFNFYWHWFDGYGLEDVLAHDWGGGGNPNGGRPPVYRPKPGETDGFIPPGANTGTENSPRFH